MKTAATVAAVIGVSLLAGGCAGVAGSADSEPAASAELARPPVQSKAVEPVATPADRPRLPAAPTENVAASSPIPEKPVTAPPKSPATVTPAVPAPSRPSPAPAKAAADRAPAPASASASPLDLKSLETRLKSTSAIGVFTKLTLKNQIDDLLDQFRGYHKGPAKASLGDLRRSYDLLLLKVLALLQDTDPSLATAILASRESIWGILSNPTRFSAL